MSIMITNKVWLFAMIGEPHFFRVIIFGTLSFHTAKIRIKFCGFRAPSQKFYLFFKIFI